MNKSKETLQTQKGVVGPAGPAGPGFSFTANGNFDIQNKKLENVLPGTSNSDAVVKNQLDQLKADSLQVDGSSHMTGDLDLRGNKLIRPGEINMNRKLIKNLDVDENDDFSAVNMTTLKKHSAAVGDIDLQEKYNVLNSKQRNLSELKTHYDSLVSFEEVKQNFLSLKETFPMRATLDMNQNKIINLKDPATGKEPATKDYADEKLALAGGRMTGSINMGTHEITNLGAPTGNSNVATKSYVDGVDTSVRSKISQEVAAIQNALNGKIDLGNMIDMQGSRITNLGAPTGFNDAATAQFVQNQLANYLHRSGGTMSGQLDMGGNRIVGVSSPNANSDATTKEYVDRKFISPSGMQQNVFLFQMEDVLESSSESNITVKGILDFPNTPHTLFKKAYKFTIGKSALNEYSARIGFNFFPIPTGDYTYVVEYFSPVMTNISVDCRSSVVNVTKQIFKTFHLYAKNIVHIQKWQNPTPDWLMVDIKSEGDASSPAQGTGWMIVYGIKGTHNEVSSAVLDTPSLISGGNMVMQIPLDMANHALKNLPLPTARTQAASKEYVDIAGIFSILGQATATYVDGYIKENAECLYSVERGTKEEVFFSPSTKAISTLVDQTLSGLNATQSAVARRPKLSTTKNAKRFFFTFDGNKRMLSNIDLNPASGGNDIVHVFILFRLKTHAGSDPNFRNGLFGHDNGGWDKFACFAANTNNLVIAGANKDGSESNSGFNIQVTSSHWQTNANASELNKWCCLSIHWDVPAGAKKSSCWVNGKKVKSFQARTSQGSTQMTFGDLNPNGGAGLNGDIQLFLLYKDWGMSDLIIKAHHKMICERYGVIHDAISFP